MARRQGSDISPKSHAIAAARQRARELFSLDTQVDRTRHLWERVALEVAA